MLASSDCCFAHCEHVLYLSSSEAPLVSCIDHDVNGGWRCILSIPIKLRVVYRLYCVLQFFTGAFPSIGLMS